MRVTYGIAFIVFMVAVGLLFHKYRGPNLAERVTLNLLQIEAKQKGHACYRVNNDNFCLYKMPETKPAIRAR